MTAKSGSRFALGQIVATPGALQALKASEDSAAICIARHAVGDWGELDEEDCQANDEALVMNFRLLSSYHLTDGTKLWIITEADRRTTTLLIPSEY